jgi:hypothetical protein
VGRQEGREERNAKKAEREEKRREEKRKERDQPLRQYEARLGRVIFTHVIPLHA